MYKIAISDLDGTLLGPDHQVSSETKAVIKQWKQSGKKFVIATGRHYIEAKKIQDTLGEPIPLITSNGARVHDQDGKIVLKQNLPDDIATAICEMDFDPTVQVNLFTDQQWYANFSLQALMGMSIDSHFMCQEVDLKTLDQSNTIKIFFWGERDKLNQIYNQLSDAFSDRVNLTFSLDKCLEVMGAKTNKGAAVETVLQSMGFTADQGIAFGDGMNDVEMLQSIGTPILMANSQKDLLNSLPNAEVTKSSKEHGVAVKLAAILTLANTI
ncbi:Cof-type HAD-IIB family hydrolase [Psychromonas sp. GE-S-Ul-11]|uniref:Cof-type HAD-IIB family hydrolase n=1 Tax=Psychromonas sp. GE-S-Ul-11 TaxID=3241170 RepID=UPI00390C7819